MCIKNLIAAVGLTVALVGCGQSLDKPATTSVSGAKTASQVHSHEGWWCSEHGVPESVCALCNAKLAADFKAKGDWCKEHDRPESQCFACHPELEAKFASQYEAKYGTQPPKPTETANEPDDHGTVNRTAHLHDSHQSEGRQ